MSEPYIDRLHSLALSIKPEPAPEPEPPGDGTPEQCAGCGDYNTSGQPWPLCTVDLDPGDPEVGPQPDIADVPLCPRCRHASDLFDRAEREDEPALCAKPAMTSVDCPECGKRVLVLPDGRTSTHWQGFALAACKGGRVR